MTPEEAQELIGTEPRPFLVNRDEWFQLAIADRVTGELVGDIGLCRRGHGDVVEIGFTLAPWVQGRGLAAEACRAAIGLVFSVSGVTAMKAVVDSRNTPAIALVQRLGMTFEHSEQAEFKGSPCTEMHFVLRGPVARITHASRPR